jgi:Asp-tRNA(Asn)/Glu-tRNA(Gln) amidotransferase A subunit family amidase
MKDQGVEVLLCPSMMPACFIGKSTDLFPWVTYLNMWNAFGWTAGHFSVTRVREDEQVYNSRFDGKMEKAMKEIMVNSKGLPIGVQVVAPEWHDEKVLAVMTELEKVIKFE